MGYALRTGRLIAVIVLLAGLVGMHVLGLHGMSEHHDMSRAAPTHSAMTHASMADASMPDDERTAAEPSALLMPQGDHPWGGDAAMAALCVLALLVVILTLRPSLLRGAPGAAGILTPTATVSPAPAESPSLDVLCISRR